MDSPEVEAETYLQSLLNRQVRIHTTDTRMFVGEFKCTDRDRNVILGRTFEYRHPSTSSISDAASSDDGGHPDSRSTSIKLNMTSRFLGLVVVPGQHITKIEIEEKVPRDDAEVV